MSTVRHPAVLQLYAVFVPAEVAELVDALASGASDRMVVEVQVLFSAPDLVVPVEM